jgi:peroxiredoxin
LDLTNQTAPDALADAVVTFAHGARKRLGTFWTDQPCLLLFLRHFACPGCWEQATLLAKHLGELRRAGVRVVLVGLAEPSRILPFRDRVKLEDEHVEVVVDASLSCHRAAGLLRSRWSTLGPRAVAEGLRLYATGFYVPREPEDGDFLQQGGAVLVDPTGRVVLHHVAHHLADHVDLPEVIRRARELAPHRAPVRV